MRSVLCVLVCLAFASTVLAAPSALRAEDGTLVLKNDHVTVVIDPAKGGAVTSMKAGGRELLAGPTFTDANMMIWRRPATLAETAVDIGEPEQTADRAAWTVSCMLPEDVVMDAMNLVGRAWDAIVWRPKESLVDHPYGAVKLTKRYVLGAASGGLTVEYTLLNTGGEPVDICLTTHAAPAGTACSFPTMHGPMATEVGLERRAFNAQILNRRKRGYLYDVPDAWFGATDAKGNGLAVGFDRRHVSFVDVDAAKGRMGVGRTTVTLKPGEPFRTTAWALPVRGVRQVHGVQAGLAASFRVTPKDAAAQPALDRASYTAEMLKKVKIGPDATIGAPGADNDMADLLGELGPTTVSASGEYAGKPLDVTLGLVASRPRKVAVRFSARATRGGRFEPVGQVTASLAPGRVTPVRVRFKPKRAGTYALAAEVSEGGDVVARFEYPLVAGEPAGFFQPTVPEREGAVNRDYFYAHGWAPRQPIRPDWTPTLDHPTPHLTYGKPLAGGPIRALWHTPYQRARDVVEVANRIDMDYDVVITNVWDWSQEETALATLPEIDRMRVALNRPHEVIVLSTFMGKRLPMDVMAEVVRQVEQEGVGLIVHSSAHLAGPLEEWAKEAKADRALSRQVGVTFHRSGRGRVIFYGKGPLREPIVRVVNARESFYLNESDYAHFARLMKWAAQRDGGASLDAAGPRETVMRDRQAEAPLKLTVAAPKGGFRGTARVAFRKDLRAEYWYHNQCYQDRRLYASWQDLAEVTRDVAVAGGRKAALTVPLPALPTGPCVADVSLVDAEGKVHDWRRVPFTLGAKAAIAEVAITSPSEGTMTAAFEQDVDAEIKRARAAELDRFWQADQDETIRVAVKAVAAPEGARIDVRCFDPWGRVAVERGVPLKDGRAELEAPLHNAAHRVLEMDIRLMDGEHCLQQRRLMGFIEPRRNRWHAFHWITYSPDSDLRPEVTGYDSRHRGFVAPRDIVMHAWCNMHMTGLFGGVPMAQDILLPGKQSKAAPDNVPLPGVGAAPKEDVKNLFGEDEGVPFDKAWIRKPCLQNPEYRKNSYAHHRDYFATRSRLSRPFNATMGDEFFYTKEHVDHTVPAGFRRQFVLSRDANICRCEHCLKAFKDYCRTQYGGDLAALNAEWSSDFKAWDVVNPPILSKSIIRVPKTFQYVDLSLNKPTEEHCPPESAWPRVIDHRRFIDHQVAETIALIRRAARDGSPSAKLGWGDLMGDTSMWNGLDAFLCAPHMDYNGLDHEMVIWRSLGHPSNNHFVGYAKQYSWVRESEVPWYMLFTGSTGMGTWNSGEYPKHREDYTFFPGPLRIFETMREIRDNGIDRLLIGRRYNDPVAINYDPTSIYLSEIQEWKEDQAGFFGQMRIASRSHNDLSRSVWQSVARLLGEHTIQFYATAYGHLQEGHFGRYGTPKLVFLPYTQCLSDAQAATLRAFVAEGGTLVGDIHSGFRDGHGRRRKAGALNDVFGIKQTRTDGMRTRKDANGKPVPVVFGKGCGGPYALTFDAVGPADIETTTGAAQAGFVLNGVRQPAFIVNRFGKGRAIYLNFLPNGYHEVAGDATEGEAGAIGEVTKDLFGEAVTFRAVAGEARDHFRAMFNAILRVAQIEDPVRTEGDPSVYRFGEGDVEYIGVDLGYKGVARWRRRHAVRLRAKRHVYDSREGKYLGLIERIPVETDFSRFVARINRLYAALPYRVDGLHAELGAPEVARGGTLRYTVKVLPAAADAVRHVIAARLIDPDGNDLAWYRVCNDTKDGTARGRIDLALNDRPGRWTLRLRDAATGVSKDVSFGVK